MKKEVALLLDVDYTKEGKSQIVLFFKAKKEKLMLFVPNYLPYLYITNDENPKEIIKKILEADLNGVKAANAICVEKKLFGSEEKTNAIMVFFNSTKELKDAREAIKSLGLNVHKHEFDIPFVKRFLLDSSLEIFSYYEIEYDEKTREIKKFNKTSNLYEPFEIKIGALDIETYSPERFSDPSKDPIIMASYVDKDERVVLCTEKINVNYATKVKDEKELVEKIVEKIKSKDLDLVVTYNGDNFDLPYLKVRATKLKTRFDVGIDGSEPVTVKKTRESATKIRGRPHIDSYQLLRILTRLGVVNLIKMDLESVSKALFNEQKEKIPAEEINKIWNSKKGLERLAEYNLLDSEVAYRIADRYLPLFIELGKLVHYTLFDVTRSSSSQLVEALLSTEASKEDMLIPNKPSDKQVRERIMQSYQGGFVYEPVPGLHENIAVLDFTSLHPTIIISHNVSPDSLNCEHKECIEKNSSPIKYWFCTKKKGFLPKVIQRLFEERVAIKKSLKKLQKGSKEYTLADARQHSLKIILNSFYGTLGYARFRWYSKECAAAVTAWSREYVKMVAEEAKKAGFQILYGDTDSTFIKIPYDKKKEEVLAFVEYINSKLPGVMNLELEGFYRRGIFVTKKSETTQAAKKKYALISEDGTLKIVGFEYVRRDWANIAKETQRMVIKAILEDGSPEKAIAIVKQKIQELRDGKTKKSDLIIYSQIKKDINAYESVGPHVAAAKKAIMQGRDLGESSVVGYIITKCGKSISDKAQLAEYVNEGNYDAEYYIKNQIIPSVIKIISEFGYSEEDLVAGGKQVSLGYFSKG
ncbi:MAG: DNA-directed DNA polymerase [Candidatus Diapherotrites archaeon]|nr:DNA-directed DNA polymerase [Candidatus Diapherotrites archaeon]